MRGTSTSKVLEELGEVVALLRQPLGVVVVGEDARELVLEHGQAAGLHADHRRARADLVAQGVQHAVQVALGDVQEPVVVQRSAAAHVALGDHDLPARVLDRLDAGHADVGVQVVVERVGPQHDAAPAGVAGPAPLLPPLLQRHRGEGRQVALLVEATDPLDQPGQARGLGHGVGDLGDAGRDPRGLVDEPEGVGVPGPPAAHALEVLVEELGLVRRHVDVDRAVVGAALAGQAQVQRVVDLPRLPPVGDDVALQHLEQQPGAAAGGVLLLLGDLVAGAHHLVAVGVAALADADAAQRRVREVAAVLLVGELHVGAGRVVVRAEPQVLVQLERVDDLARVHLPLGVPDALEVAHGLDEVGAVLLLEQLGLLLPVAVLARQRPAVGHDQVGGLLHERPVVPDALGGAQVEGDPRVHAPLAEVAVHRPAVAVPVVEVLQVAQVGTHDLGRHRGVLPAGPVVPPVGREGRGAQAALADLPDRLGVTAELLALVEPDAAVVDVGLLGQPVHELLRLVRARRRRRPSRTAPAARHGRRDARGAGPGRASSCAARARPRTAGGRWPPARSGGTAP